MDRAYIDNAAAAVTLIHMPHAGARGEECAVEMDCEHFLPVVIAVVLDGMHDLDAGITYQDIDRAPIGDHLLDASVDLAFVSHIHRNGHRLSAGIAYLRGGSLGGFQAEIGNCDVRAFTGIGKSDFPADAACRPGDDGRFSFQFQSDLLSENIDLYAEHGGMRMPPGASGKRINLLSP